MRVKVGVIGAGNMGKNHIRLINEMNGLFELSGVYDPDIEVIQRLSLEKYATSNADDLIKKSEAVIIAAPSCLHKELAIKAANLNKHLLVEKPLALSQEDAQEICDKYKSLDSVLMVGHVERFNGAIIELEKILKEEKILAINMERCSSKDLRISDTDVVYDLMIHDVDILLHSLMQNKNIKEMSAYGRTSYSAKYMDYVQSLIKFEDDVIASIVCSRTTESKIRRMTIHCEKSFVDVDLLNKDIDIYRKTQFKDVGEMPSAYRQESIVERVFVPNNEPLKVELKHFYDCIVEHALCKTDGDSAIESIRVLDDIKKKLY